MSNQEFDHRYPAMFQPGGESYTSQFETSQFESGQVETSQVETGQLETGQFGKVLTDTSAVESDDAESDSAETETDEAGLSAAQESSHPEVRWSARTWVVGLVGIALTFAAAIFCLVAAFLIPSARSVDPSEFHGVMVQAWGYAIIPGAPALATAALAMLAMMLLLGSRHYGSVPDAAPRNRGLALSLWGGSVAVGLVTLGVGVIALFGTLLFPELYFDPALYRENVVSIPWVVVLQLGGGTFLIAGVALIAAALVLHPRLDGSPGRNPGKSAVLMGGLLLAVAFWAWFAPELYPLQLGQETLTMGEQQYSLTPWPYIVSQHGAAPAMVGAAVVLWGMLLLTTRGTPRSAADQAHSPLE